MHKLVYTSLALQICFVFALGSVSEDPQPPHTVYPDNTTTPAPIPTTAAPLPPLTPNTTISTAKPTTPTTATTTTTATTPTTATTTTTATTPSTVTTPTTATTTTTKPTTPSTPITSTATPTPGPKPEPDRKFDGPSFIGGMILTMGLMAIAFVSWKFYKARTERNYHTL